jgi:hypothetical protein
MTPTTRVPRTVRFRRAADWGVIGVFVVGLAVVSFGTFVREPPPLDENRSRHPPPPLAADRETLLAYPAVFDRYFGDRVGYRDVLLGWHLTVSNSVFVEPASTKAWVGRDGWLFLNVNPPTDRPDLKPTIAERVDDWADALAARHDYLTARDIGYVVMVVPDKSSVYPEYLSGRPARHPPPEPTARLTERLTAREVRVVDPLPALRAAKQHAQHPLYTRRDSHWTFDGGRVAYRLLADALALPDPLPEDGYEMPELPFTPDLGRLVGLPEAERTEVRRVPTPRGRVVRQDEEVFAARFPSRVWNLGLKPCLYTCPDAPGPAVVVFHDSFGPPLLRYLSADCRRVAAVPTDSFEPGLIDEEKPAVVVQQIVARKLYSDPAVQPPTGGWGR